MITSILAFAAAMAAGVSGFGVLHPDLLIAEWL